jgi:predicted metal-binding membrane protein
MIPLGGSRLAPAPPGAGHGATALLRRSQFAVLATLLLLTVVAWGATIMQMRSMSAGAPVSEAAPPADDAMAGMAGMNAAMETDGATPLAMDEMDATGWSFSGLAVFVASWAVMMAAMMLPAVAPLLLLYRKIAGNTMSGGIAFSATWILVAGYLLVWTTVGAVVYALPRAAADVASRLGASGGERPAALFLGIVLVVAGLYQFTPLKHACLRQCQSPFGFVMGHWRNGRLGALQMGVVHGAYCLGCCWALFAVLVAAGVMSLAWMLLLTLVVFVEKVFPVGKQIAVGVGLVLVILGVLVASGETLLP